jgi:hypothetical protein
MPSLVARHPRVTFFVLGVLTVALCGWLLVHWMEIANDIFGMRVMYTTRPPWLRLVMSLVKALPWLILAALVAIRIARGPVVRPLSFAIGGATVYVVTLGLLLYGPVIADLLHRRDFDASVWRRNERADALWPTRLTMVDDLLAKDRLRGLSRDSVDRLLGPRDSTNYWTDWDLVYWLGPERGLLRIDSEWLVVRFGPDGRVSEYRIVRD